MTIFIIGMAIFFVLIVVSCVVTWRQYGKEEKKYEEAFNKEMRKLAEQWDKEGT